MRQRSRAVLAAFTAVGVLSFGYLLFPENYCFFYPSIDTRYAPHFSEQRFAEVRVGMTHEEVIALLGEPFGGVAANSSTHWAYTQDGKCSWKDWAWLGREIVFVHGRVSRKIARIYYD